MITREELQSLVTRLDELQTRFKSQQVEVMNVRCKLQSTKNAIAKTKAQILNMAKQYHRQQAKDNQST